MPAGRPAQFLANLATAMRTAAESGRETSVQQCRENADAYVSSLQDRSAADVADMRKLAAEDIAIIRDRSRQEAQEIQRLADNRVGDRNELLERQLQELDSAVVAAIGRTEQLTDAFANELAAFFERIVNEADPASIATLATQLPSPPDFGEPDPAALVAGNHAKSTNAAQPAAAASTSDAARSEKLPADLPYGWWMDSPSKLREKAEQVAH
jgi:carboxylesterase type B